MITEKHKVSIRLVLFWGCEACCDSRDMKPRSCDSTSATLQMITCQVWEIKTLSQSG